MEKSKIIFQGNSALSWLQPVVLWVWEICGVSHILPQKMGADSF